MNVSADELKKPEGFLDILYAARNEALSNVWNLRVIKEARASVDRLTDWGLKPLPCPKRRAPSAPKRA